MLSAALRRRPDLSQQQRAVASMDHPAMEANAAQCAAIVAILGLAGYTSYGWYGGRKHLGFGQEGSSKKYEELLGELVGTHPFDQEGSMEHYKPLLDHVDQAVLDDAAACLPRVQEILPGLNVKLRPGPKLLQRYEEKRQGFQNGQYANPRFDPLRIFCDFAALRVFADDGIALASARRAFLDAVRTDGGVHLDKDLPVVDSDGRPLRMAPCIYGYFPSLGHVVECQVLHLAAHRMFTVDSLNRHAEHRVNFYSDKFFDDVQTAVLTGKADGSLRQRLLRKYTEAGLMETDVDQELLEVVTALSQAS